MERRLRALIHRPFVVTQTPDIILEGLPHSLLQAAYKYRLIQQRIGEAWETAPLFYGWVQGPDGIDLINHTTQQVAEVKNNIQTDNSSSRRQHFDKLREYTNTHPNYEACYIVINDTRPKNRIRDGIRHLSGVHALRTLFGEDAQEVIRIMRRVVGNFLQTSRLNITNCYER